MVSQLALIVHAWGFTVIRAPKAAPSARRVMGEEPDRSVHHLALRERGRSSARRRRSMI